MHAASIADIDRARIAMTGLGYVGPPRAAAFGVEHSTLGFDIDASRVAEPEGVRGFGCAGAVPFDARGALPRVAIDGRL